MFKTKLFFSKCDDDVTRFRYKNFNPNSTLNLNVVNKKTTFNTELQDDLISKTIQYYIAGEYKSTGSTKPYNGTSNIKMTDNFVAHLFSQIEVMELSWTISNIQV